MAVETQKDDLYNIERCWAQLQGDYYFGKTEGEQLHVDRLIAELRAARAVIADINDDTQCCLCNAMLVVDDGDGQWDRMDHKPDCVMAGYLSLVQEQGRG